MVCNCNGSVHRFAKTKSAYNVKLNVGICMYLNKCPVCTKMCLKSLKKGNDLEKADARMQTECLAL